MKIKFLTIAIGVFSISSYSQSNFANLWEMQGTANKIEVKVFEKDKNLNFVLEGLIDESSRMYLTGVLNVTGLNQYQYQDKNTDCSIDFNFINNDSLLIKSNLCNLYTLNDSIDGLFTSNSNDLLTPKVLGSFNSVLENDIKLKTGDQFSYIKQRSQVKRSIKTEKGEVIFMAQTLEILNTDPEIVYYLEDGKISIFFRSSGSINTYRSAFHYELDTNVLEWMQKTRSYSIESN